MEPQSESHKVVGPGNSWFTSGEVQVDPSLAGPGVQTDGVQRSGQVADGDASSYEPSEEELQSGALETIAYFEAATGQKVTMDDDDGASIRILYALSRDREGWSSDLEANARAALQYHFPDNGGSSVSGPL